ncbi:MAG: toll/interleukin-1 receptor domain-containing protein [Limisphaerales bacterium]
MQNDVIFISYSHADAAWRDDLHRMAAPLKRYGGIQLWSDADIEAGSKWRSNIQDSLDKASVCVLLVSPHFLASKFISEVEMPYLLKAHKERGLKVLWVLVSHCLYEETPLGTFQAAVPPTTPLDGMRSAEKNAALKKLCEAIKKASLAYERPVIDPALNGRKVQQRAENLRVLASPARRRVELFVRADSSGDWYHQGPIREGQAGRTCWFGSAKTKPGTGFHIVALTTDVAVPDQKGKPTKLPKHRTQSDEVRVIRA